MDIVKLALEIASQAHQGQVDKAGVDYIKHPVQVSHLVETKEQKAAALLHDVIEDTDIRGQDLLNQGIPVQVVEVVQILTKSSKLSYGKYLERIKANEDARLVKLADLSHNSDLSRIPNPGPKDFERLTKYKKAIAFLKDRQYTNYKEFLAKQDFSV